MKSTGYHLVNFTRCSLFAVYRVFLLQHSKKGGASMQIQSSRTDEGIAQVMEQYADMVYRLAVSQMKNRSDAEDIFQEVFLRYIAKTRVFESEEHRKAWLLRVTINCCKKMWTSPWRRKTVPLEGQADSSAEQAAPEDSLWEYLDALPQKYRAVLHLFYYEGCSTKEISLLTGARESTVRSQLSRARAMLKEDYCNEPD